VTATREPARSRLAFSLPLDPARLLRARHRIRDYLHTYGLDVEVIDAVVLSIEEAMTNAVRHSGASDDLEVALRFEGSDLVAEVQDHGAGFDVESFDPTREPDLLEPGGRGLFLIARLMDELALRCDGGLEVRAVKRGVLHDSAEKRPKADRLAFRVPGDETYRDARQRAFLEEIDEGFLALDWEYRFLHANTAYKRMVGMTHQELQGRVLWEIFPYGAEHPVALAYRAAMELGQAGVVEYESPAVGHWLEARTYPTSSGISVYFRKIDERKRKERELEESLTALRASEERYRALFENMIDGFAYCRMVYESGVPADFVYLDVNPAFERLTGLRNVVGRLVSSVIPGIRHDNPELFEIYGRVALGGRPEHFETYLGSLDIWFSVSVFCPQPEHFVAIFENITERRRAELERDESEQRLRFHLENTPLAVVEWDGQFVVTRWAGEAEAMFGWSAAETVGRPIMDLRMIYEADVPVVERTMAKLSDGKHSQVVSSNRNYSKDGRVLDCTWYNSVLLDDRGQMSSVMSLVEDVTERKRAEETQREIARLSQALNAIDVLVHSSLRADEIVQAALTAGATALGADAALVTSRQLDGFRIDHLHGGPIEMIGRLIPDELDTHGLLALESRETIAIGDVRSDPRVQRKLMEEFDIKSLLVAPLIKGGAAIGCLYFAFVDEPHSFTPPEVDFVRRLAASLSLALENATLYEEQRSIATQLQRSFLHTLPTLGHLEVGLVEAPASEPALIGGDFWDVFELPDKRVGIVVGDVAGKGVPAAGLTETVRSTMRAFAAVDSAPSFILRKTNELLLARAPEEVFVTALVLVLDTETGHVSFASAGHPAPIHVGAFSCALLEPTYGPPLGSFPSEYTSAHARLALDDYLVLYTDGVTEAKRGERLFGEHRLIETVGRLRGLSAQVVVEHVRDAAEDFAGQLRDDLEVVALRMK
jgi:PAS domain S-box-containing protein